MKKIKAPAKINLTLDVLRKRDDGYHEVSMIMQTIDLYDDVIVKKQEKGVSLKTNLKFLPTDDNNIAVKAAKLFFSESKIDAGASIEIFKRIPISAGLAGGSTNAAAVLIALNELYSTNYTKEDLCKMGKKLGADVPYCIMGGTMLAEGIGEKLTRLKKLPQCYYVLCKPPFSVSTPYVYSQIKTEKIVKRPDTKGVLKAIENSNYSEISHRLYNVMEEVTAKEHREINEIQKILIDNGANGAIMSGSGPSTFGLFDNEDNAKEAYNVLKSMYKDTFIGKTE